MIGSYLEYNSYRKKKNTNLEYNGIIPIIMAYWVDQKIYSLLTSEGDFLPPKKQKPNEGDIFHVLCTSRYVPPSYLEVIINI